uniref:Ribonuclease A-domain domain-containing protein n=1 Tax=Fundulus heteroclitus TaxID=8078 RepID=A0A3Q2UK76_FUNHE
MKILVVAVLLLALSATEISGALNFFQKHVVDQKEAVNCNEKMKEINKGSNQCKPINTFFLSPNEVVKKICDNQDNKKITQNFENEQVCFTECKYNKTRTDNNYKLICKNKKPVHLDDRSKQGFKDLRTCPVSLI